jgi:lipopolysaccharide/colanic/teichoic acid biosynthesis glycosyltransferase
MVKDAGGNGFRITMSGDQRVTRIGRLLRRYKIDELPQLWNVLRGEMSLVGPRPELAHYVAGYSPQERVVLSARPGITDPSALAYVNEEEILASQNDPENIYRMQILPDKLARSIAYLRRVSLASDVRIMIQTIASVVRPASQGREPGFSPSGKGQEFYSTKEREVPKFL